MSRETQEWIDNYFLVGDADKLGTAWHWRKGNTNHYPGAIPVEDIVKRQLGWTVREADVRYEAHLDNFTEQFELFKAENAGKSLADLKALAADLEVETDAATARNKGKLAEAVSEHQAAKATTQNRTFDGKKIYYRSDNGSPLGIHSDGHNGHGYEEWLLKNTEKILSGDLHISSSILMRNGARMAIQFSLGDNFTAVDGEEFRPYLLAFTSFDGSLQTTYARKIMRVVCDNTFDVALGEKGMAHKVKHTKYSNLKVKDAQEALALIHQGADEYTEQVKRLTSQKVTDKQWQKFLEIHVPMTGEKGRGDTMAETKRQALTGLWTADPRVTIWKNTVWGVINAVNTWTQHMSIVRSAKGGAPVTRAERREENVLLGKTGEADQKAYSDLMLALA